MENNGTSSQKVYLEIEKVSTAGGNETVAKQVAYNLPMGNTNILSLGVSTLQAEGNSTEVFEEKPGIIRYDTPNRAMDLGIPDADFLFLTLNRSREGVLAHTPGTEAVLYTPREHRKVGEVAETGLQAYFGDHLTPTATINKINLAEVVSPVPLLPGDRLECRIDDTTTIRMTYKTGEPKY